MTRFWIEDEEERQRATDLLDGAGIDADFDGGDRIMVEDEDTEDAIAILDNTEIDYDEI